MKKFVCTLLLYLCCLPLTMLAQDLNPGQQSQGLLESRNVTVDYSTGIFHYQIPLYTLKSGDYELPISLRYTGKGVKVSDNPGLVGYNWTLDTGGVVTRTVRGGIPDESYPYGYLQFENDTVPLSEDATRVNRHKRDGECDIFTAVFGGKSVNFIIRKDNGGSLHAEPLERTDVKIECVHSGSLINGWIVTDNDGTRYSYMRKEWTTNLNKQDEISFNGISNAQYPSSWYLTRIEPVNGAMIEFFYDGSETALPTKESRNVTNYIDSYQTRYEYGQDIFKPVHDYEACKSAFEARINSAEYYLRQYAQQLELEMQMAKWKFENHFYMKNSYKDEERDSVLMEWMAHPIHYDISEEAFLCHRVLGIASNLTTVNSVTNELMELLTRLATIYQESVPSASLEFLSARSVLEEYLKGNSAKFIREQVVSSGISFKTVSPVLRSIRNREEVVFFYNLDNSRLQSMERKTDTGENVSSYHFLYDANSLTGLEHRGNDSLTVAATTFEYYGLSQAPKVMGDVYGYAKRYSDDEYAPFDTGLEEDFSKMLSLKGICLPDGGKICLDYEQNGYQSGIFEEEYGGIRIKSLTSYDAQENRTDSISYSYEYGILPYLVYPYNFESEAYTGFADNVWHSRMKSRSNTILRPGNNGLYYRETHERISGQGKRTYLFHTADIDLQDGWHPYWLWGVPTYTIEYDESGHLVRVLQNIYHTDTRNMDGFPEFMDCEELSYSLVLPQMMANEKYMDPEDLAEEMGIPLNTISNEPYIQAFRANILSRVKDHYTICCYNLRYGGATLLAEQREYRPLAGEYTDYMTLMEQQPCSRTVYHYDNLQEHTRPTRIVSYGSQGDSTVVHQVYAGDMAATASEAVAAMQEANILAPAVKRATMKDGALVEEEVTVYGTAAKEDGCFYAPVKVAVRTGSNGCYTPDTLSLYAGNMADYQERKEMTSAVIGEDSYLPVGMTEQGMHTALLHDPNSKWCVLQATDVSADKVVAVDCRHYKLNMQMDNTDIMGRILYLAEKLQEGIVNYDPEMIGIDNYQTFRETPFYERGKRMLELLARESDLTEVSALLDSCAVDGYIGIGDYIVWQIELAYNYFPAEGYVSPWNMPVEEMQELLDLLMEELYTHNGTVLLDYLRTSGGSFWNGFEYVPQTLAALSGQQGYKLYLVPMKEQALVTYTVTHNGGTEERVLELSGLTPGVLKEVSVDLSGYTHVSGITVTGFGAVQHLTLVPEGTEFEATSYNADGTVSVKYNQDGQMQYHEYDNAGRLIRVRDENGKILETSDYHVKNTTF